MATPVGSGGIKGSQCHTDRSVFCKMAMLQQYCMIPAFQRICCKSCNSGNTTSIATPMNTHPPIPHVTTRSPRFTMNTTRPPNMYLTGTTTGSVSYTEYGTWAYTMPTAGVKVADTMPSVQAPMSFFTEAITTMPFGITTQTKVTLSVIENKIEHATNSTDRDNNDRATGVSKVDFNLVTTPTADMDEFKFGSGAHPGKVGMMIHASGDDELSTSSWNEAETGTSMGIKLTIMPTFEEMTTDRENIETLLTTMASSPVTEPTTPTQMILVTTTKPPIKEDDNNAIEEPFLITSLDNEFPENNIIPRKGRVFFRERTRNKRIQELLEAKRNFLHRMKRAQGF